MNMDKKIIKGGLISLAIAGAAGLVSLGATAVYQAHEKHQKEMFALVDTCKRTEQALDGNEARDSKGQEFLDSMGINYKLKEGEAVGIIHSEDVVYAVVQDSSTEYLHIKGNLLTKRDLDKYLSTHNPTTRND